MISLKDKEFQLSIENEYLKELIEGVDKCEIDQTKESMHTLEMEIQDAHKSYEAYDQDMKVVFTNKEKEISDRIDRVGQDIDDERDMTVRGKASLDSAILLAANRDEYRRLKGEMKDMSLRLNDVDRESLLLDDIISMNRKALVHEREEETAAMYELIREAEERQAYADARQMELDQIEIEEQRIQREMDDYQRRLRKTMGSADGNDEDGGNSNDEGYDDEDDREELLKALEVFSAQLQNIGQKKQTLEKDKQDALGIVLQTSSDEFQMQLKAVEEESQELKANLEEQERKGQQHAEQISNDMALEQARLNEEAAHIESQAADVEQRLAVCSDDTDRKRNSVAALSKCDELFARFCWIIVDVSAGLGGALTSGDSVSRSSVLRAR